MPGSIVTEIRYLNELAYSELYNQILTDCQAGDFCGKFDDGFLEDVVKICCDKPAIW